MKLKRKAKKSSLKKPLKPRFKESLVKIKFGKIFQEKTATLLDSANFTNLSLCCFPYDGDEDFTMSVADVTKGLILYDTNLSNSFMVFYETERRLARLRVKQRVKWSSSPSLKLTSYCLESL